MGSGNVLPGAWAAVFCGDVDRDSYSSHQDVLAGLFCEAYINSFNILFFQIQATLEKEMFQFTTVF